MADLKARVGGKLSAAEQKKVDKANIGSTRATAGRAATAGQYLRDQLVVCPYCGAGNWIVDQTTMWHYYTCWNCWGTFKY